MRRFYHRILKVVEYLEWLRGSATSSKQLPTRRIWLQLGTAGAGSFDAYKLIEAKPSSKLISIYLTSADKKLYVT